MARVTAFRPIAVRAAGACNLSSQELAPEAGSPQPGVVRREIPMGKRGRKKRSRRKNAANHGKRPNS
ncbi:hypothetical protein C5E51_26000 [Nocardia nova]|nr:hypothetical protein C5E51_26000 [Nocardia nova]